MTCASPIPYETLVALWAGELDAAAADAIDDHLFGCDACAAASQQLGDLLATMRELIPPVVSPAQRDQLAARGLTIREMAFDPGGRGEFFFAREVDLMVFRLRGDLAGADRVDVEMADPSGEVQLQLLHVPFDAARGEVLITCQQHYRFLGSGDEDDSPEFRVYANQAGIRRHVGSYVIKHVWPPL